MGAEVSVPGKLYLDHDASELLVWECNGTNLPYQETIFGVSSHGIRITLLGCTAPEITVGVHNGKEYCFEAVVKFKLALLGDEHFYENREEITVARFSFEGLTSFFGHNTRKRYKKSDDGSTVLSHCADTAYGDIRILSLVEHSRSWSGVEEDTLVEVEFNEKVFADKVWEIVRNLHFLFGLCIRNLPKLIYVEVRKEIANEDTLLFSGEEKRGDDSIKDGPPVNDSLASPEFCPENFTKVIQQWIAKILDSNWNTATLVFFDCFFSNKFSPERHIIICNAFYQLPACDRKFDENTTLTELSKIVSHRFEKVQFELRDVVQFDQMENVITLAINCRNFFVHGQNKRYSPIFMQEECRQLLTSSLEFIFAMSLLLDCGWNVKDWIQRFQRQLSERHPFSSYIQRFPFKSLSLIRRKDEIDRKTQGLGHEA